MKFRAAAGVALSIMFVLLAWRLSLFFGNSADALRFPFGLDYGEGIVWQQALLLFTPEAYGRIDGFPTIVFHYTPFYHLVAGAIAALTGADMLYTGRAISIGATLLTGLVICLIIARAAPADTSRWAQGLAAAGGGLVIFCFVPVMFWAQLMRVDMLAFLLSFLGYWLGLKAFEQPRLVYVAALCFVAAVYTKQTSIIAPAALFGLMLWLRPRLAFAGIGTFVAVGLAVLSVLAWVTHGGFLRHAFLYNINEIAWERLDGIRWMVMRHAPVLTVALIMALGRVTEIYTTLRGLKGPERRATIAANRSMTAYVGILAYVLAATPMLILIIKVGSDFNYLIEWLFAITLLVGTALFEATRTVSGVGQNKTSGARLVLGVIGVPFLVAAQVWVVFVVHELDFNKFWSAQRIAELERLSARVRVAHKPIISDDMVILLRSSQRVVWEPAIFANLARLGVWDESAFVARVRREEFAMFITVGRRGDPFFEGRYTSAVADAMDAAYPLKEMVAGYTLHLPLTVPTPEAGGTVR